PRPSGPPTPSTLEVRPAHTWYYGYQLAREEERGLDAQDDHLHAATIRVTLDAGQGVSVVLSSEAAPAASADDAGRRRHRHETGLLTAGRRPLPAGRRVPPWISQLVLAADQFVVRRALADDPDGASVIAGYHWFGDWGRDTMIALPGLTLTTGRPDLAR